MRRIRNLLRKMNAKKGYLMVIALISIFIVVGYASYAMFTSNQEQKEAIKIIAGTLTGELKVDNVETDNLTINQGETKEFTITLRNNNDRTARYLLYYTGTLPDGLEAGYVVEEGIQIPPEDNGRNITVETIETYKVKVKNSTTSSQTIQLKLDVGLEKFDLTVPNNGHLFEEIKAPSIPEDTPMREYINEENTEYNDETKDKMFVYHHEAGDQQENWTEEELTDYRYIGADPNNYATFNNETAKWRVIGVFTVENEKGEKEKRIKLIRKESIGSYFWDDKNVTEGVMPEDGSLHSNDWPYSRLMMLLNLNNENNSLLTSGGQGSLYWNKQSGKCPYYLSSVPPCNFSDIGLTSEAQEMIGDAKWYLGGTANYSGSTNGLVSHFYGYERGKDTMYGNFTNWIGKVGLIYPSDYGYATSGGGNVTKEQCLAKAMYSWNNSKDCYNNDWIFNGNYQWTLTHCSGASDRIFLVYSSGRVSYAESKYKDTEVHPSVYLIPNIQITGTGSKDDPFVFTK